ncbi:MAG: ABC transporter permease, partial [Clostridia bacterium]|nr:ABC transporter permease [Clostridia bacterium]
LDVGRRVASDGSGIIADSPFRTANEDGTPAEHITDTVRKTYTVVGVIERPANNVEKYSNPGYTVITCLDESAFSGSLDVYVRYTKSGLRNAERITAGILGIDADIYEKAYKKGLTMEEANRFQEERAKAKYVYEYNSNLVTLETNPLALAGISTLGYAAAMVLAIIVAASVFCIKNSFDISITEKIRQYGMLRSIGATGKQVRKNVFFEATVLGLFGLPLGILLGFAASYILIIVSTYFIGDTFTENFKLSFIFPWQAIVIAVTLGVVTVYLSAFRSAGKASRISPLDSIRSTKDIVVSSKRLSSPSVIRKVFGMGGELSYKNLKRNRRKYRTTVVSITVSVAVFISLTASMSMAFELLGFTVSRTEHNIQVSAYNLEEADYNRLIETTEFDNILNYSVVRKAGMELVGDYYSKSYIQSLRLSPDANSKSYVYLTCVSEKEFNRFCSSIGLDPQKMNGKAILCDYSRVNAYSESGKGANKYIRKYKFEKGDIITGSIENELGDSRTDVRLEIEFISEKRPFGLNNKEDVYLIVSDAFYDSIAETSNVNIFFKTDNSDKLQNEFEKHMQGISYRLTNNDENYRQSNNFYTLIGIFLYGFIIVISLIGVTTVFNTITTNMELRKPEFAMLRSVGMTNREFNRMIRLESLFMGVRALLFGIPIGLVLSYLIYFFLVKEAGIPFKVPFLAIIIAVAAVFVMIFMIMAYSMGKIKKQNIIETIRNENI